MILQKKDVLVSRYVDGIILPVSLSDINLETWRLRYDKVGMSIMCQGWGLQNNINDISRAIEDLDFALKGTEHQSRGDWLYRRIKIFASESHLVEFFYDRTSHRSEISVNGAIRITVRTKTPDSYVNHVILLLELENIFKDYCCHVSNVEMAFDCSDNYEFKEVRNKLFLKYSRNRDNFHCDGSKAKSGKGLKIPGHAGTTEATDYYNGNQNSKQAKVYAIQDNHQGRRRIEISMKRSFLKRIGLNTFSEILMAGPDLFFNQFQLIGFDKRDVWQGTRKGNNSLGSVTESRLDNLLKKPSTEILKSLLRMFPSYQPSIIKVKFGEKIDFPNFIFDSPYTPFSMNEPYQRYSDLWI